MYDEEFEVGPYDNVEFPLRKSGGATGGTWPRIHAGGTGSAVGVTTQGSGVKLYGHQTTKSLGGGSKLAPLVEVEGAENSDILRKSNSGSNPSYGSSSSTFSSGTTTSGSSSASVVNKQTGYQSGVNSSALTSVSNPGFQTNTLPKSTSGVSSSGVSSSGVSSSMSGAQQYKSISRGGNSTTTGAANTPNVNGISTASTTSSLPMATTASTTKSTVTSVSSATSSVSSTASSATKQSTGTKPVISMTNSDSLYMASEVGSGNGTRQKKQPESNDDDDFKRQDLNPGSRRALEDVYTQHGDFYQLNTKVLDEGSLLKQDVLDIYRKAGETLTYEQLLQGMLVDGERFLLGSCWLFYTHVQFTDADGSKVLREPYGRGRIGLTSKRALFLSTETYTDANLEEFGNPKKSTGGYKLEVSKMSAVVFKNIPLSNFHSAEMEILTGTAAQTKITRQSKCCGCFSFKSTWVSTPPMTRSITSRVMRLGVSMPPWQTRMYMDVTLDPSMSLTVARDFISQLHSFAPHMH